MAINHLDAVYADEDSSVDPFLVQLQTRTLPFVLSQIVVTL